MARTITYTVSLGARGPAGPPGDGSGTELTSYATQIATLGDYPATFPADHAPVTVTGDGISLTGQQLSLSIGTGATQVAAGNDSRFTDARTPTAHKTSHATGGSDALSASDIGAVATTGNETIAGAKTFSGQTELTGQAATNDTSAMTRALVDARYGRIGFAAYNSSTSVSAATWAVATFASEIDDTNSAWNGQTFTVPESGLYLVSGVYAFTSVSDGSIYIVGCGINTTAYATYLIGRGTAGATAIAGAGGAVVVPLSAGDVLRMLVYCQNATTGHNAVAGYCTFSAYKIRP